MIDVNALERQWRRYRFRKFWLPLTGGVVFLALAAYMVYAFSNRGSTIKNVSTDLHLARNMKMHHSKRQNGPSKKRETTPTISKKETERVKQMTSDTHDIPIIRPDLSFMSMIGAKNRSGGPSEKSLKKPSTKRTRVEHIAEKSHKSAKKMTKNDTSPREMKKGSLLFKTSENNNTLMKLTERFEQNKDPHLATYIALSYFNKKNYRQAARWSIIANSLDPAMEESWLLFAKAKVALGQRRDAIKALKVYLNQYPSKKIESYLNMLEAGR